MKKNIKKFRNRYTDALNVASKIDENITWESWAIIDPNLVGKKDEIHVEHKIDNRNHIIFGITESESYMYGFYNEVDKEKFDEQMDYLISILNSLGYEYSYEKSSEQSQLLCEIYMILHYKEIQDHIDDTKLDYFEGLADDSIKEWTGSDIASLDNFRAFVEQQGIVISNKDEFENALNEYRSFFNS